MVRFRVSVRLYRALCTECGVGVSGCVCFDSRLTAERVNSKPVLVTVSFERIAPTNPKTVDAPALDVSIVGKIDG